jgi:dethiobiotin synthetase
VSARLLVVSGTGTGIGKTHATAALLHAWATALAAKGQSEPLVAGLKPVESGAGAPGDPSDGLTLEQASTFHVKRFPPPYLLARPVSPHLAAEAEGRTIELRTITSYVETVRALAHGVAVELPGGLFTPLGLELCNAEVALALGPHAVLLVAPDRLGVLHDVAAATRAASALGLGITGLVLVAPELPDASTGTNAAELGKVTNVPVIAVLPRADIATLAVREDVTAWVRGFVA